MEARLGAAWTSALHVVSVEVKLHTEAAKWIKAEAINVSVDICTSRHTRRIRDTHMMWHPGVSGPNGGDDCWGGWYLCGLVPERRRWGIPAPVHSHSKHMTTGWLSKPLSGICLILSLLCPLSSSIERSRFASLCFSFSAVRRMTIMEPGRSPLLHTHKHSHLEYQEHTDDMLIVDTHTHPYLHTCKQCEMNASSHKPLSVPVCVSCFSVI